MKYITTLDNFISPQNGMMILDHQHILEGDRANKSYVSPTLIDMRLEIINLRQDLDGVIGDSGATFILQTPSDQFDNAQALNSLTPGMMKQTSGVVATAISGKDYMPGNLTNDYAWIGKKIGPTDNVPTEVKAEDILSYFNLLQNHIWVGNASNKAIGVDKIPTSVLPSVSWGAILRGNFSNELEETRNYIQGPIVPGIYGNIVTWGIDDGGVAPVVLGRNIGDSGVNLAEFLAEIQEYVSAAASSAEEAATSATAASKSATAAAESATAAAESATAAAEAVTAGLESIAEAVASGEAAIGLAESEAIAAIGLEEGEAIAAIGAEEAGAVGTIGLLVAAAAGSASSASSSASDASSSKSDAANSASSAAGSASSAAGSASSAAGSLASFLATPISLVGAVSGSGLVGSPIVNALNHEVSLADNYQLFKFNSARSYTAFIIKNQFVPITGTNSRNVIQLSNSNDCSYRFLHETNSVEASHQGTFSLISNNVTDGDKILFSASVLSGTPNIDFTTSVVSVKTPTSASHAATKAYVDSTAGGTGTVTSVGLTTATSGLTISDSPITSSGNININLNTELQSLSAIFSNGLIARTGAGAYSSSTITAGSSLISVTNGNGVSGNPTIDLNQDNITRFSNALVPLAATSTQSFSFNSANATTNYKIVNTSTASMPALRRNHFLLENSGGSSLDLHFWTAASDTSGYGTFRMSFIGSSSTITALQVFYSSTDSNYFFQLNAGAGFNSYVNFYGNITMHASKAIDFGLASSVIIPEPTLSTQAATKGYVDSSVSGLGTVISVGATTTSAGLTIAGSPITTSGSFTFTLSPGLQNLSSYNSSSFLNVSNNLSDLASASTARTNLGLTDIAIQTVTQHSVLVGGLSNSILSIPRPGSLNRVLLSGNFSPSSKPHWSDATYPVTTTANRILYSSSNNVISEITTGNDGVLITSGSGVPAISSTLPSAVQVNITSLGTIGAGAWNATNIALNKGGTNASLTASNGGIVYSTASAMAILNGTATASRLLMSGASTVPSWSSSTYPSSVTTGQILFGSASNVISGLTSANNGLLVTNSSGIPSIASRYVDDTALGNVFLGTSTGNNTTTGTCNTGIGTLCLSLLTSGSSNVALGFGSGRNLTTGFDNVAIGSGNILNPAFLNSTTSNGCVAIGSGAGYLRSSYTNCVFLGKFADASSSGLSNSISIGYNAFVSTDNTCVIGDTSSGMKLVLGATTGSARIHVVGGVKNLPTQDSCIRASSSAFLAAIEIENTTPNTGKLFELRSSGNGDFDIVDRTGLARRFIIKSTGTCGIGTATPLAKLHITESYTNYVNNGTVIRATDSSPSANIEIENSGSGGSVWAMRSFNGNISGLSGQFDIADMTNSRRVMIFDSSGNVGVGMAPDQLFTVNTTGPSKINPGSWIGLSDARFKNLTGLYTSGLSEILKIIVRKFKYKKESMHTGKDLENEHVGLIAQEIEKILPETVTKFKGRGLDDARMFDMTNITYALINAVKELNDKVTFLENNLKTSQEK